MRVMDFNCKAGLPVSQYLTGRYFRILTGEGRVRLETDNGHSSAILAGIGLDLVDVQSGQGFTQITITSPIDQVVTVLASELPTTDSRTLGDFDVGGLINVVNAGGTGWRDGLVTLDPATPGQVLLPADAGRLVASFQPDTTVYIGGSPSVTVGGGIRVEAGQVVNIENTAALYVASALAGTVRTMESMK